MNSCIYICDIDAEKPVIKYVCIFLLYAQDCDKHRFDELWTDCKTVGFFLKISKEIMKYDTDFRKTFSFFHILITCLSLQFLWCSFCFSF